MSSDCNRTGRASGRVNSHHTSSILSGRSPSPHPARRSPRQRSRKVYGIDPDHRQKSQLDVAVACTRTSWSVAVPAAVAKRGSRGWHDSAESRSNSCRSRIIATANSGPRFAHSCGTATTQAGRVNPPLSPTGFSAGVGINSVTLPRPLSRRPPRWMW